MDTAQPAKTGDFVAQLIAALGLDEAADEGAIIEAVKALKLTKATARKEVDPREYAPLPAFAEANARAGAHLQTLSAREADAKVAAALRDGYITPAAKDWALQLC